jgi:hypothetical protein
MRSIRARASGWAVALVLAGRSARAGAAGDAEPPRYALQITETVQVLDLGDVSFHRRVESAGRYVEISAPGSALAVTHPVAIGWLGLGIHCDPIADGHLGLVAWGMASPLFGQGLPSDAATYDAMGRPTPRVTLFGTIGPEVQTMLGAELLLRASVGFGARYVDLGSASASSFILQPRVGLESYDRTFHRPTYGAFLAFETGGAGGKTVILGTDLGFAW